MDKKLKITILSDSVFIPTGYSNQSKLLSRYLSSQGHEIHYLANSYVGATLDYARLEDGIDFNFKIYGQGKQPYFMDIISPHLKKTNSDIFFILLDTFMLYPNLLNLDLSPSKSIFWFPTDGGAGLPIGCDSILKKVDCPVAMAEFGQKQVKDYHNLNVLHIPHGTEPNRFFKLPDDLRMQLRHKWGLDNKFVVGVVARNQGRKMLDRTLKAFAKAKENIPNAILLMHLDPNDQAQAFNMFDLIKRYNLENRIKFTGMSALNGFTWEQMNEVYNLMDVFFLSTSGEGFGIPIIEAMACEVPVLATGYTTTFELVTKNKAGEAINLSGVDEINYFDYDSKKYDELVANGTLTGGWDVERGLMDINDGANKLIKLYNSPELLKTYGKNGRKAVLEKYDFNKHIGPAFEKLMEDLAK